MPDPLLGLHTYVAALDDMSGLLTLHATTPGPAGSLVVELDDVTFALDGADPRLLNFVEVDGAALTRDARTMELFQTLVGDHVAVAAAQLARSGATKPTRLQPEPNRRELPVPPRAIRFALAHSGMTVPGLTEAERAAATIEAIASARRLGLLDHLPDGLDLLADAAAVLAETLARTPGDAPASLPPELATLTADRSMSSAVADSCDDAASVARPADAAILSQVAQRLRARPSADDRDGRPVGPGRTTATSGHDLVPVQVLPDSLPLLVSATVPAVARTGADEYEVRLPGWAGRVDGWWARAFRVGSSTPLAVVPMRDEGTDAVALMLLARHDAEQFELDIVDEPSQPRSSERVSAFRAAIATGQRAARLERLDRPTDATYGLVVVLDEVETLQRVRSDARDRALNALRQLIDEIDAGRFPGLYLVITGTPAFFDGPQGAARLPPLAQRLHTDFTTEVRFDNPRAVQVRLPGFTVDSLCEVGGRARDVFVDGASEAARERLLAMVDDPYVRTLALAVTGDLGGRVGVAPRVFLKKLVGDVLDRVDQFDDFDPRKHYKLTLADSELTPMERNARSATSVDDIDLDDFG